MPSRFAFAVIALVACLGGCIQRTITITSEPDGALVHLNDVEVGRTPVTVPFTFYGTYDVRLEREGYQTLNQATEAQMPWWEAPGPDLIAEALPGNRDVNLQWDYVLEPTQPVDQAALIDRAKQLRATFRPGPPPTIQPQPTLPAPAAPPEQPAPTPSP